MLGIQINISKSEFSDNSHRDPRCLTKLSNYQIPGVLTLSEDPDMLAELVENIFYSSAPAFSP